MSITLAVDAMGADGGSQIVVKACSLALADNADLRILMVGLEEELQAGMAKLSLPSAQITSERLQIVAATEVISMEDTIEVALRKKRDASMRVAVELVKEGKASAVVSAGNTGALMAVSRYVLKTIEGIDRPAIATFLPNQNNQSTLMLDLGANIDCQADHLLQFAIMGKALVAAVSNNTSPRIGLLNIGSESSKGSDTIKQAAQLLQAQTPQMNFIGYVEGDDIFRGKADVVVCDGFVGNVALKTTEGLAQMLIRFMREEFNRGIWARLAGLFALPVLKRFKKRTDHRRYNGAALLGLRALVVKSHGSADSFAFRYAILRAYEAVKHDLTMRIVSDIEKMRD